MLYKNKEELTKKLEEAQDGSFHLLSKEEYDEMLKNYYETQVITEVNKQIGEKVKEIHSRYDADLKNLFGEEKSADEKTYDFLGRKVKELQEKVAGKGDESEELKKLRADAAKKIEAKEAEIESLKTSITKEKFRGHLTQAMAGLEFNENIPENLRNLAIENNINKLVENAREEDGKVVWNLDGVDLHDESYKPLSAKDVVAKVFSDIKKPDSSGGGGGQKPPVTPSKMDAMSATEMLVKEGLRAGTPSFQAKFKELTGIGSENKE